MFGIVVLQQSFLLIVTKFAEIYWALVLCFQIAKLRVLTDDLLSNFHLDPSNVYFGTLNFRRHTQPIFRKTSPLGGLSLPQIERPFHLFAIKQSSPKKLELLAWRFFFHPGLISLEVIEINIRHVNMYSTDFHLIHFEVTHDLVYIVVEILLLFVQVLNVVH